MRWRMSDRLHICDVWRVRPLKGENYFKAEIVTGRVGPEQAAPKREF